MTNCQVPGGCPLHAPAVFMLTFKTAPVTTGYADGLAFTVGVCRAHADVFRAKILREGGSIVAVEDAAP